VLAAGKAEMTKVIKPANDAHMLSFAYRQIRAGSAVTALIVCLVAVLSAFGQLQRASLAGRAVTITSEPNASIWIDGILYGKCDKNGTLAIKAVGPGAHTLKIRADGFKEKSVPLGPGPRLDISLVKTTDEADLAFQEAERLTTIDREKSAEAYRKALKLRPTNVDAALGLARVLSDAGDFEEALKAVAQARRISPANATASAIQGRIHKENGDDEKAIAAFKRAITEGHGVQPEAYTGLGLLYKEKAESSGGGGNYLDERASYDEAAKYLKVALKQLSSAPDAVVVYQLLGLVYERQNRTDEAIALYEDFLRLFPDVPEATAVQSFIVQLKKSRLPSQ